MLQISTGERWKNLLTIAISALQFALLPLLARAAGVGRKAGVIGAAMPMLYLECSGDFEAPLVALTVVSAAIATFVLQRWQERERTAALCTGAVWGFTALVSAQLLLCGIVYESFRRLTGKESLIRRVQLIFLFAVGLPAAVLPWTMRNYLQLGAPVISRDNSGLELYISSNDQAAPTFDQNVARKILVTLHPHGSAAEARLLQQVGEIRYCARKRAEALNWINAHLGAVCRAEYCSRSIRFRIC